MILAIGLLSLLQIAYLPGALLRRCFPGQAEDGLERAAYTFALSLIGNTGLVTVLVLLGIYRRWAVATIIAAELAALVWLATGKSRSRASVDGDTDPIAAFAWRRTSSVALGSMFALTSIALLLFLCYLNWGTVFNGIDDVANWNRWAQEWARGQLPTETSFYPQLQSANWSISYVLLGRTDVQMFAKATTTLYPLFTVALFVSLALRRSTPAFLFGAGIFVWMLLHYLGPAFVLLGYADVPVAFFGFLTFYVIYRRAGRPVTGETVALLLIFAGGTLITKQGGVYTLAAASAFAAWHAWSQRRSRVSPANIAARSLALGTIGFAAIWFGYKFWQIHAGHDYSNLDQLTRVLHHGRTYGERLARAADLFWHTREDAGPPVAFIITALLAGSLLMRATRWITLGLILPFVIFWGCWFSYELRNASMCFALVALVCGVTLERAIAFLMAPFDRRPVGPSTAGAWLSAAAVLCGSIWILLGEPGAAMWLPRQAFPFLANDWIRTATWWYAAPTSVVSVMTLAWLASAGRRRRWHLSWRWSAGAALTMLVVAITGPYGDARLVAGQQDLLRNLGTPAVNQRLYAAVTARDIHERIMTDYIYMSALPGVESLFSRIPHGVSRQYESLLSIAADRPEVGYFLLNEVDFNTDTEVRLTESRQLQTVFLESGVRLIAVNRQ